jgi:hypothetical protein
MRIGLFVNEDHFVTTTPFRNCRHLPTTQCACADFWDFAKQRNGSGGREKDLLNFFYTRVYSKKKNFYLYFSKANLVSRTQTPFSKKY